MKKTLILFSLLAFFVPLSAQAGISLVTGGALSGTITNGGNVTITFPGGVQQGDVVILFGGHSLAGGITGPSTSGYTLIASTTAAQAPDFGVWYKMMGSTPDANVVGKGSGGSTDGTVYGVYILRGIDAAVLDTAAVTAGPTASTNPNAALITTVTNDALVLDLAASNIRDTAVTAPTGYTNAIQNNENDTNKLTLGGATKVVASHGSEDPAAWTGWNTGTWFAITVALRPGMFAPTVATNSITPGATAATLSGTVSDNGESDASTAGFAWGTSSTLQNSGVFATTSTSGTFTTGASFTQGVSGLISGTTYYYRAYATNTNGTGYGTTIQSFLAGSDTTPARGLRLFEGFIIKLISGTLKLLGR